MVRVSSNTNHINAYRSINVNIYPTTKTCSKCHQDKSLEDFTRQKRGRYGRMAQCKHCVTEYQREYNKTDAGKKSASNRKIRYRFGVSDEEWTKMFNEQNGCCKICGRHHTEFDRQLSVDHCHKTGKIRGLLCGSCNRAIGLLGDSKELLIKAANYL